jgi:flagellum-specific peptidoglycan hydrolase FlgJ
VTANEDFLLKMYAAAESAAHIFPDYAACEAALETEWGTNKLFVMGNNVFGSKQARVPVYLNMPVSEKQMLGDTEIVITTNYVRFPQVADAFTYRMDTLRRYPAIYSTALNATDGTTFINEVCGYWQRQGTPLEHYQGRWAADPDRASKVLAIYAEHSAIFPQ